MPIAIWSEICYYIIVRKETNQLNRFKEAQKIEKMIQMAKEAYITVMGESKWNSLTDEQKHDVVMLAWYGIGKSMGIENLEEPTLYTV